jgi:hypothetical protein
MGLVCSSLDQLVQSYVKVWGWQIMSCFLITLYDIIFQNDDDHMGYIAGTLHITQHNGQFKP